MKRAAENPEFAFSRGLYGRLLLAYPAAHRTAYGAAMAQLFHDQCRDAWQEARAWGLLKLWLQILPDLASTSILERLAALKERKNMTDRLANVFAFRVAPVTTFFRVFILVFLLVLAGSVAVTFMLPETYASTARVKVTPDTPAAGVEPSYDPYFIQTTFETIQSQLVLNRVVERLKLNETWGKKYFNGEALKTSESVELLRGHLQLAPVKNSSLIAIMAYSDNGTEAAQIANAVAESYIDYRHSARMEMADQALNLLSRNYADQEREILKSQTELAELQKKYQIPDDVTGLSAQLLVKQRSIQEMRTQLDTLHNLAKSQWRNVLPTVVPDSPLAELTSRLLDAEQKWVTLTNDYAASSVEVTRVTALLAELNRQIDERASGIMSGLESQLHAARASADELADRIQRSKPSTETQPYWQARQNLEGLIESHKLLFAKLEDQRLAANMPPPMLAQITDRAEPGRYPVKPNKPLNIVGGAVAGMFLAGLAGGALALLSFLLGKRAPKAAVA